MRLLVAGGAGFIGSHFVRTLLSGGYPAADVTGLTVVDRLSYAGLRANLDPVAADPRLAFVVGDIADPALLAGLLPGHDAVVNFAAETHVDRSIADPQAFVRSNVLGAQALFQAALDAGTGPVVQVSTDEIYGPVAEGRAAEDWPLRPSSPYAATKAAADLMALAYRRTYGLDVRITRASNTYGPYQYPDKLIPLFVTELLAGRAVPLYGDGLHVRDWLHVDDHCRAVWTVLTMGEPGGIYNVAGGCELTNRELTERLLAACGRDWDSVEQVADRPGHDRRYGVDAAAIGELGWRPLVPVDEGLPATVRWYADNRAWWEPLKRTMRPLR